MKKVIVIFLLFSAAGSFSQTDSLSLKKIFVDHIQPKHTDSIFVNRHILGSIMNMRNEKKYISGIRIDDTLYVYVKKKNRTDSFACSINSLESRLKSINKELFRKGYFFSIIKPDSVAIKKDKIHIYYRITNLKKRRFNDFVFVGKKKMPDNIKKYLWKQYGGQCIDSTQTEEIENFIETQTSFQISKPTEFLFRQKTTKAYVYLTPKKNNSFDGNLGFAYKPASKKIELLGNLHLNTKNLFGANENIQLKWQKTKFNQNFFLSVLFPFIRGSSSFIDSEIYLNRKDVSNLYASAKIGYGLSKKNNDFEIAYRQSKDIDITTDKTLSLFSFGYTYIFPKNQNMLSKFGIFKTIKTEVAYQPGNDNKDFIFYSNFKYFKKIHNNFFSTVTLSAFYSNSPNKYLQTKKNFFRNFNHIFDDITKALSVKTRLIYHKSRYLFYSIHDFESIYSQSDNPSSAVNLGVGADFLNKNQVLTLSFYKPIILSQAVNPHVFMINVQALIFF